jgi:hypothetical protein
MSAAGSATFPKLAGYGQTKGGVGSASLPLLSGSGETTVYSSIGEATLPVLTGHGIGGSTGSGILPFFTGTGTGHQESVANGSAILTKLFGTGTAKYVEPGVGSAVLPLFTASGAGHQTSTATGAATLPMMSAWGFGFGSSHTTVVVNTRYGLPTEYTGWHFESFCKFKGMYLGSGDDGITQLFTSETDNGSPILFRMRVGLDDVGIEELKRLTYIYLTYRGNGMMVLEVETDEQNVSDVYSITSYADEKLRPYRFKLSEAREGKGWAFEIQNVNGSSVDINKVEAIYTILTRRR